MGIFKKLFKGMVETHKQIYSDDYGLHEPKQAEPIKKEEAIKKEEPVKETKTIETPAAEEKEDIFVVGYFGENDPYGRPRGWFSSEQGQKSLEYYRAQYALPFYNRQIHDLIKSRYGYMDNLDKCLNARDKWPTAYFYYYLQAVNPDFELCAGDLNFIILSILIDKEESLEPLLYFVEHFNPKAKAAITAAEDRAYAFMKIVVYISQGAEEGVDTYKEKWIYDEKTYINQQTGKPFSQDQILYAATLFAEHPEFFPDVQHHLDSLFPFQKTEVTNNFM